MKQLLCAVRDLDVEHTARLEGIVPCRDPFQQLQLAGFQLRNKAHCPDVDAKHGNVIGRRKLGRMEDRSVAAEADQHLRVADLLFQVVKMDAGRKRIALVYLKRQTHPDRYALGLQNALCLLRDAELLVAVGIGRHNNFHDLSFQRRMRLLDQLVQQRIVIFSRLHGKVRQKFNVAFRALDR